MSRKCQFKILDVEGDYAQFQQTCDDGSSEITSGEIYWIKRSTTLVK